MLGPSTVLFLGGDALQEAGLLAAAKVAAGTGTRLLAETFPARMQRGAGLPDVLKLPYPPDGARKALDGVEHLVLVGAVEPVAFFGYPGMDGRLVPEGCTVHVLATPAEDGVGALHALADRVAADATPQVAEARRPELPTGRLDAEAFAEVVGALLPERAVVVDEAVTSGYFLPGATGARPRTTG